MVAAGRHYGINSQQQIEVNFTNDKEGTLNANLIYFWYHSIENLRPSPTIRMIGRPPRIRWRFPCVRFCLSF